MSCIKDQYMIKRPRKEYDHVSGKVILAGRRHVITSKAYYVYPLEGCAIFSKRRTIL